MYSSSTCVHIRIWKAKRTLVSDLTTVLCYTRIYPKTLFRHNPSVQSCINSQIQKQVDDFCQYITGELYQQAVASCQDAQKNGFPFHPYEAILQYEVTYNQNCYLSMYRDQYEFTGGAHGNTVRFANTWTLADGKEIALADLFPTGQDYQAFFIKQITAQAAAQEQQNPGTYFENYPKLIAENFDAQNFYLTCNVVTVFYPLYSIAPYATGIAAFSIPYDTVGWHPQC